MFPLSTTVFRPEEALPKSDQNINTVLSERAGRHRLRSFFARRRIASAVYNRKGGLSRCAPLYIIAKGVCDGHLRAGDIGRRFDLHKKKRQQPEKPTAGVIVADRVGFEPTSRLRDYLISSLLCNCDGGVRFEVVSVSPVPAESRLKSGFFARKALRDRLFGKWVQIGIFPDFGEKCGKIGEKNRETAIHRRIELPTDENLFLRCYKWMYSPLTGTAFPR